MLKSPGALTYLVEFVLPGKGETLQAIGSNDNLSPSNNSPSNGGEKGSKTLAGIFRKHKKRSKLSPRAPHSDSKWKFPLGVLEQGIRKEKVYSLGNTKVYILDREDN